MVSTVKGEAEAAAGVIKVAVKSSLNYQGID